jgi:hypothetical protein
MAAWRNQHQYQINNNGNNGINNVAISASMCIINNENIENNGIIISVISIMAWRNGK